MSIACKITTMTIYVLSRLQYSFRCNRSNTDNIYLQVATVLQITELTISCIHLRNSIQTLLPTAIGSNVAGNAIASVRLCVSPTVCPPVCFYSVFETD